MVDTKMPSDKTSTNSLAEAHARISELEHALDSTATGVLVVDDVGTILYANNVAHQMIDRKKEGLLGLNIGIPVSEKTAEITILGSEGKFRIAEMVVEQGHWEGRRGFLVTLNDITERKGLASSNKRLDEIMQELERSNKSFSDFAYAAAHDLKSPLQTINSFARHLVRDKQSTLSEKSESYTEHIIRATSRGIALVNRLLEYARAGGTKLKITTVNLQEVMDAVLENHHSIIDETNAQIRISNMPHVEGDMSLLEQAFQNVVGNALKYRQQGITPIVEIIGQLNEQKTAYEILVKDNGVGFEQSDLDRVFKPFTRLVSREEFEGSGIGLATVEKIMAKHGGSITATSEPDVGSTFIVTFPLSQSMDNESRFEPAVQCQKRRLMIIGNSAHSFDVTMQMFSSFDVIRADNTAKALKCLNTDAVDAILLDCHSLDDNGRLFFTRLQEEYPKIGRYLTSKKFPPDLQGLLQKGAVNRHFAQPVDMKILKMTISENKLSAF